MTSLTFDTSPDILGLVKQLQFVGETEENYVGIGPASLYRKAPSYLFFAAGYLGKDLSVLGGVEFLNGELHLLKRAWVNPNHRNRIWPLASLLRVQTMFLDELEATKSIALPASVTISFNWHNRSIYDRIERTRAGKASGLGSAWPSVYREFVPSGIRVIHGVRQLVCVANRASLRGDFRV